MVKKRGKDASSADRAVTAKRAARLYRLLRLLDEGPQTRAGLARRLRLDVRGFYRDLELLRSAGIDVPLEGGRYVLHEAVKEAISRLPFPDPRLTLGEATQLAKGRAPVHRKLRQLIREIIA